METADCEINFWLLYWCCVHPVNAPHNSQERQGCQVGKGQGLLPTLRQHPPQRAVFGVLGRGGKSKPLSRKGSRNVFSGWVYLSGIFSYCPDDSVGAGILGGRLLLLPPAVFEGREAAPT